MSNENSITEVLQLFKDFNYPFTIVWQADNAFSLYFPSYFIMTSTDLDRILKTGFKIWLLRTNGDYLKLNFVKEI